MNIYKKGVNRENCKDLVGTAGLEPAYDRIRRPMPLQLDYAP